MGFYERKTEAVWRPVSRQMRAGDKKTEHGPTYTRRSRDLEVALSERGREQKQCERALVQVRADLRASEAEVVRLRVNAAQSEPISIAMSRGHVCQRPNCGALKSSTSARTFQSCNICHKGGDV